MAAAFICVFSLILLPSLPWPLTSFEHGFVGAGSYPGHAGNVCSEIVKSTALIILVTSRWWHTSGAEAFGQRRFAKMKKRDFTPEFIRSILLDYNINQHFPHDELDEIGSKVYITGISDLEIDSVKDFESNFIVEGHATLEIDTDIEDGEFRSDSYPMAFTYEFDEDGKIVQQLFQNIDTSSFFAGNEDFESYLVAGHQAAFQTSVMAILSLLAQPPEAPPDRKNLHRMLYVNVVTILECYLSDFFISRIEDDKELVRKMVETTPAFKERQVSVSDVFRTMDGIDKMVRAHLARLVWHRLKEVSALYERVLGVRFPSDLKALRSAIDIRHELVHRNGKKDDGTEHEIGEPEIRAVIKAAAELVAHIEARWLDIPSVI
jgi:hypothetical protein